jgi:uncharacterized protein YggU (UPF0235/DUF167 family)
MPSAAAILALADSQRRLAVRATPNASADAIVLPAAGQQPVLSVRTTATPADGEANDAVLDLLAKALHCPRSALTILRGQTSRNKIVQIAAPSVQKA